MLGIINGLQHHLQVTAFVAHPDFWADHSFDLSISNRSSTMLGSFG